MFLLVSWAEQHISRLYVLAQSLVPEQFVCLIGGKKPLKPPLAFDMETGCILVILDPNSLSILIIEEKF